MKPFCAQTAISDDLAPAAVIALFDAILLHQKSSEATLPLQSNQTVDSAFSFSKMEHLYNASKKPRSEAISDNDFRTIVSSLWENAEHWSDQLQIATFGSHQLFLIAMWLFGKVPPPQCIGISILGVGRCLEHVASTGKLIYCPHISCYYLLYPFCRWVLQKVSLLSLENVI